jgi:hypothetical protein
MTKDQIATLERKRNELINLICTKSELLQKVQSELLSATVTFENTKENTSIKKPPQYFGRDPNFVPPKETSIAKRILDDHTVQWSSVSKK